LAGADTGAFLAGTDDTSSGIWGQHGVIGEPLGAWSTRYTVIHTLTWLPIRGVFAVRGHDVRNGSTGGGSGRAGAAGWRGNLGPLAGAAAEVVVGRGTPRGLLRWDLARQKMHTRGRPYAGDWQQRGGRCSVDGEHDTSVHFHTFRGTSSSSKSSSEWSAAGRLAAALPCLQACVYVCVWNGQRQRYGQYGMRGCSARVAVLREWSGHVSCRVGVCLVYLGSGHFGLRLLRRLLALGALPCGLLWGSDSLLRRSRSLGSHSGQGACTCACPSGTRTHTRAWCAYLGRGPPAGPCTGTSSNTIRCKEGGKYAPRTCVGSCTGPM
jgi:hypothetical protein